MSKQSINLLGGFDPFSELDGRTTPPPVENKNSALTPTKKGVEKVKKLIGKRGNDDEDDGLFLQKELDVVNKTFTLINQKESPIRKKHAKEIEAALKAVQFSPGSPEVVQPQYTTILDAKRRSCVGVNREALNDFLFSWGNTIMTNTSKILGNSNESTVLVNLEHILKPTLSGKTVVGLHFICEENEHLEKDITVTAVNPQTAVYFGLYKGEDAPNGKHSTFFPRAVHSKENLLALLEGAKVIAQGTSSSLLFIEQGWNIAVECLMKNSYAMWSAYPIFCYAEYHPERQIQVTEDVSVAPQQIPDLVKGLEEKYTIENDVIVDIAGKLPGVSVDKGVYLRVPRSMVTPPRRVASLFNNNLKV